MKNYTRKELEEGRPDLPLVHTVEHCLKQLFRDRTHLISDEVVANLTFEELIGCLLQARDAAMDELRQQIADGRK